MENEIITKRIRDLREEMAEQKIDYYLIPTSDYHNSEYVGAYFKVREFFSGFTGSNGTLVVSDAEIGLWTDGRYFIQAEKELQGTGIRLYRMMEEGVPTITQYLEQNMKSGQVLGFDGKVVSAQFGKKIEKMAQKKGIEVYHVHDLAENIWRNRPKISCEKCSVLPDEFCGISYEKKVEAVREKMKEAGAEAFLLTKLDDLMWLFNVRGKDVPCNPVAMSYGFVTFDSSYFFVQKEAKSPVLEEYCKKHNICVLEYCEMENFLQNNDYSGKVLLDVEHVNYTLYRLVAERAGIVEEKNPTELLKAVKCPQEIEKMRQVFLRDNVVVTKFIYWLKQNIGKVPLNEYTVAQKIDSMRRQTEGFLDLSFETIAGYKENAAMMHYEATENEHKELAAEGMLLVDSGGQYMGGTTDITRTIVLGEISDEIKCHFSAVAAGMVRLSDAKFLYGCTGRNLDILARGPLWDMNIDYKCGTGHGIGYILNVHEGPHSIRWKYTEGQKEYVLEEGMVVTNEPGVYKQGSHGIRTENVLLVKKGEKNADGQFMQFETLTYVPIDREALDKKYLSDADVKRIDAYHKEVYERISPYLTEEEAEWLCQVTKPL